jgi:uncharacterized protein YjbI with pentapeptide repeats
MRRHFMKGPIHAKYADYSGSQFEKVSMAGTRFYDVNLSGSSFEFVNMSGWKTFDVNFTGLNADTSNMAGGRFKNCNFTGVAIEGGQRDGFTIDGIRVSDLLDCYQAHGAADQSASNA